MTADEFIRVAGITLDEVRKAREQGADLERRRIRREVSEVLKQLRACATLVPLGGEWAGLRRTMLSRIDTLDAATRAKKGKRK